MDPRCRPPANRRRFQPWHAADGDLYGKAIRVEFVRKLRDEEKFDGLDALVAQMDQDAEQARAVLARQTLGECA